MRIEVARCLFDQHCSGEVADPYSRVVMQVNIA